jgi:septum formation protein
VQTKLGTDAAISYAPRVIERERPLGLGSASPRRKALLETLQIPLVVIAVDADERRRSGESAEVYLDRVTRDKLARAAADVRARPTSALLVADTIVLVGDDILGKPSNAEEATAMLGRLSGRAHEVRTRFAIGQSPGPSSSGDTSSSAVPAPPVYAETVSTMVHFRKLENDEIRRYVMTGEGMDKAGSYAVQGIGAFAVQKVEGSYANVVGLPVCEVVVALRRYGFLSAFP